MKSQIINYKQQRKRGSAIPQRAFPSRSAGGVDRASQVIIMRNPCHDIKIGTWNVRTLQSEGKIENIVKEMQREGLEVLGLDGKDQGKSQWEMPGYYTQVELQRKGV
jgi:hypothetical protein